MGSKTVDTSLLIHQGQSMMVVIPADFVKSNHLKKGDLLERKLAGDTLTLKVMSR